jgi:hypothetical protein
MPDAIFLCFGEQAECWNCGGWVHAGDPPEVPEGEEPIGGHYCSTECHDEALRFMELAKQARVSDWCPQCAYDCHEHAPDCPKLALMHPIPRLQHRVHDGILRP